MLKRINVLMTLLVILALGFYFGSFQVREGTLEVGADHHLYSAGLQFKWPWQKVTVLDLTPQLIQVQSGQNNWTLVAAVTQPQAYLKNADGQSLSALVTQAWNQDAQTVQHNAMLAKAGISVNAVLLTGVNLSEADQAKILQNMQGLSTQIAQTILTSGQAQAQSIRTTAETSFLATQKQGLDLAAQVMGASQAQAVKMLAPLYQKNPALFKAYMQAKAQISKNSNS